MMKKLQQEEKKDQENPERRSENKFEVISFQNNKIALSTLLFEDISIHYPDYTEKYHLLYSSAPFHPPKV